MSHTPSVSIMTFFQDLPDPRRDCQNKKHRLIDILTIALCGVIAGCESAVEIDAYGRQKEAWLRTFLKLDHGIPSHDPFSRVLQMLDPRRFHDCFVKWVQALHDVTRGEVVAIDGKTLRRSFDTAHGLPPLHLVSAWATENRLVLGEVPVDSKSNEITAVPKLLEILELTGAIVTLDAMGCQKEIAGKIREQGADYVLAVKENQPHLHEDLSHHFDAVLEDEEALPAPQQYSTTENNRGRHEARFYYSTPVPETLRHREAWRDLQSVGCVISLTEHNGQEAVWVRYSISSLGPDAKRLARAVRAHWGIETSEHWVLDVVFQEDQCRARLDNAAENFALLRRLAMNLIRSEGTKHAKPACETPRRGLERHPDAPNPYCGNDLKCEGPGSRAQTRDAESARQRLPATTQHALNERKSAQNGTVLVAREGIQETLRIVRVGIGAEHHFHGFHKFGWTP